MARVAARQCGPKIGRAQKVRTRVSKKARNMFSTSTLKRKKFKNRFNVQCWTMTLTYINLKVRTKSACTKRAHKKCAHVFSKNSVFQKISFPVCGVQKCAQFCAIFRHFSIRKLHFVGVKKCYKSAQIWRWFFCTTSFWLLNSVELYFYGTSEFCNSFLTTFFWTKWRKLGTTV